MLVRTLLGLLGLAELLAPRRFVDFWMRLATTSEDVELRRWVYTAARLEGLAILLWLLTRGDDDSGEAVAVTAET
ncbi:hypothetical protein [Haloarchaeobius iranensis]|uniref:Uncharacterized protein n=1 Tax=Haloarchaeobius iranensis TaxID=996166 RepID=A0A1G9VEL0_9EURY|nr:hypothetical protein [Haloarchaeobius iranensis]SDM70487.1 hypothetical protein SAMN05192554_10665 [Haloarchaeobius iranensis]